MSIILPEIDVPEDVRTWVENYQPLTGTPRPLLIRETHIIDGECIVWVTTSDSAFRDGWLLCEHGRRRFAEKLPSFASEVEGLRCPNVAALIGQRIFTLREELEQFFSPVLRVARLIGTLETDDRLTLLRLVAMAYRCDWIGYPVGGEISRRLLLQLAFGGDGERLDEAIRHLEKQGLITGYDTIKTTEEFRNSVPDKL
jgi:hypothetical protein